MFFKSKYCFFNLVSIHLQDNYKLSTSYFFNTNLNKFFFFILLKYGQRTIGMFLLFYKIFSKMTTLFVKQKVNYVYLVLSLLIM